MARWRLHSLVIIFKSSRCFDYNYTLHLERLLFRQTLFIFVFRFLVGSICLLRFPRPVRATVTFHPPCRYNLLKCDILLTLNAFHCQCQCWIFHLSKIWDSQKMSVFQFSFFIFKVTTLYQVFSTGFFLVYQFGTYSPLKLAKPNFSFLFCLFSDIMAFALSFLSLWYQQNLQFPVLGGEWKIQNLFIYVAILGTLSPMVNLLPCGMPGGVLGADQWSLLSLTLRGRKRRK